MSDVAGRDSSRVQEEDLCDRFLREEKGASGLKQARSHMQGRPPSGPVDRTPANRTGLARKRSRGHGRRGSLAPASSVMCRYNYSLSAR